MIRQISIKSFKSLLDVELELGRVNVFIGANGSGKSNLLEAIGMLGAAANGRVDDEALMRRGVRPGVPELYKSSFLKERPRPSIRLEAINDAASYAVELTNPIEDPKPAWGFSTETVFEKGKKILGRSNSSKEKLDRNRGLAALKSVEWAGKGAASQLLDRLASYAIYAPNTDTLRGLVPDPQQREPLGLAGGRLPEAALEILQARNDNAHMKNVSARIRKLIDWASSYGSRSVGEKIPLSPSVASAKRVLYFKDKYMNENRNGLTSYDASEGALYVLFAAGLATLPSAPAMLAIDNVDHGLNPRLARALMSSLCEWVLSNPLDKQMLMTTHNPLVLDGLALDHDEVRLFAVERSRKGKTVVRRVQLGAQDLEQQGEAWTVSRLWVMGHLGGMPDV